MPVMAVYTISEMRSYSVACDLIIISVGAKLDLQNQAKQFVQSFKERELLHATALIAKDNAAALLCSIGRE